MSFVSIAMPHDPTQAIPQALPPATHAEYGLSAYGHALPPLEGTGDGDPEDLISALRLEGYTDFVTESDAAIAVIVFVGSCRHERRTVIG